MVYKSLIGAAHLFGVIPLVFGLPNGGPSTLAIASRPNVPHSTLTAEQIHTNILASFPSDRQIFSDDLFDYARNHTDKPHLVYLRDDKAFVDLSQVELAELSKREALELCLRFTKT